MDRVRKEEGNDLPWKGKEARTFKHFVLSPSPADGMDLRSLRELSQAWVRRFFPDYHVAIVYHDDNHERLKKGLQGIPHAHICINALNTQTGRKWHSRKTTSPARRTSRRSSPRSTAWRRCRK